MTQSSVSITNAKNKNRCGQQTRESLKACHRIGGDSNTMPGCISRHRREETLSNRGVDRRAM